MKGQYTQLNLQDRHLIEHLLNERTPLNKIASTLHRDSYGLRREIKKYRSESKKSNQGSYLNNCAHFKSFQDDFRCRLRGKHCRSCSLCIARCQVF